MTDNNYKLTAPTFRKYVCVTRLLNPRQLVLRYLLYDSYNNLHNIDLGRILSNLTGPHSHSHSPYIANYTLRHICNSPPGLSLLPSGLSITPRVICPRSQRAGPVLEKKFPVHQTPYRGFAPRSLRLIHKERQTLPFPYPPAQSR